MPYSTGYILNQWFGQEHKFLRHSLCPVLQESESWVLDGTLLGPSESNKAISQGRQQKSTRARRMGSSLESSKEKVKSE